MPARALRPGAACPAHQQRATPAKFGRGETLEPRIADRETPRTIGTSAARRGLGQGCLDRDCRRRRDPNRRGETLELLGTPPIASRFSDRH
jgi:hypothetical protein